MMENARKVMVAAHRGNSRYYPENTMVSYESALKLPIDQIEIDVHMTKDRELILMHDHKVDRTTNGTGLVRDFTAKGLKELDAGAWKDPRFADTRVPMFEELLVLMKYYPEITLNVELKDYPEDDQAWGIESCDRTIAMLEDYHMRDRIWINTFSASLLEHVNEKYPGRYRVHGYWPEMLLHGQLTHDVLDLSSCVCLFRTKDQTDPVRPKEDFEKVIASGTEVWVYYPDDDENCWERAIANGACAITANDPAKCLAYLRRNGLHI